MILIGLILIQIGLTLLQTAILIGVIGGILSRQSKHDSALAEEIGQLRYQVNDLLAVVKQHQRDSSSSEVKLSDETAEQWVVDRKSERFRDHPSPPLGTHINLSGK